MRRTELLEKVWDLHFDPMSNVVDVHVGNLRRKLPRRARRPRIHTVRGVGFMLHTAGAGMTRSFRFQLASRFALTMAAGLPAAAVLGYHALRVHGGPGASTPRC